MRYYATPSGQRVCDAMTSGVLDCIDTPQRWGQVPAGARWCADNGCFANGYPGDTAWWAWLSEHEGLDRCAFAVAPDVVGDAAATLTRSAPWLPRIRSLGVPAAFVAQDGLEGMPAPWADLDVLFIGGSTGWKLGPHVRTLVAEAHRRGKPVHMGRVNSWRRVDYARHLGCNSVDGTFLAFGPDINLPRMLAWLRRVDTHRTLFGDTP